MEMAETIVKPILAWVFLGLFGGFCAPALAQDAEAEKPKIVKIRDRVDDKILLELTHDTWLDGPGNVDYKIPSIGFKAYFFSDYTFGDESIVSFAWGFGLSFDNVHSDAEFRQEVDEEGNTGDQILTPIERDFEKNKFATLYLEIPIEFRIITKGKTPFKFAAGFRGGYLLNDFQKLDDTNGKVKIYDFEHVSVWRYGVSGRIGLGPVQLTGYYSLVPLIEDGKGTELTPISVGLAFTIIK